MWTYKQATGELFDATGKLVATGYAGHGEGRNNPAMEQVKNTGPLPKGMYTIQAPHYSDKTGPYTMDLQPDSANQMYGRGDFRMHGDNLTHDASEGCIIMPRWIRGKVWTSGDHTLQVQ